MDALIIGLIWFLIAALVVAIVCYIVTRILAQIVPGAAAWVWVVWAIGGLVLLLWALRLFGPALH